MPPHFKRLKRPVLDLTTPEHSHSPEVMSSSPPKTTLHNLFLSLSNAAAIVPLRRASALPAPLRTAVQASIAASALSSALYHAAQRDGAVPRRDAGLSGLLSFVPDAGVRALLVADRALAVGTACAVLWAWARIHGGAGGVGGRIAVGGVPIWGAALFKRVCSARVGTVGLAAIVAAGLSEAAVGTGRPGVYAALHGSWHVAVFVFAGLALPV